MAYLLRQKAVFTFRDFQANTSTTTMNVPVGTAIADVPFVALRDAVKAVSTAAMERYGLYFSMADPAINPVAGVFNHAEEKVMLEFQAVDGSIVKYEIPAPDATVFLAGDTEKVDPLDALIVSAITAIVALATTWGQAVLIEYVRGYRKRNRGRATKLGVP